MELRQLRYFLTVAQELNITRAAERLNMSQPPLSNQIRGLEEELGVTLFVRGKRRLTLTEEGSFLLQRAAQLLEDGRLSLEQVALSCGYGGAAQLGQAFRKAYGQTPLAYRRACHGGQARPETPPQPRDGE